MSAHDRKVADLLDRTATMVGSVVSLFGPEAVAAGSGARTVLSAVAQVMRLRGVSVDQVVAHLRTIDPLKMPWGDGKVTGKDPT